MKPSWMCVAVSQNVTVRSVEYAIDSPCFGRAMHEKWMLSGTGHSKTADPVDASIRLILRSDTTKRSLSNQRRPVLNHGVTFPGMSTSKRPSLLSYIRTESGVAVAIRSPCGEYLTADTQSPWSSVCTRWRVAMSQMEAVHAETSRVELGEKSTPRMLRWEDSSLRENTFSAFHAITSAQPVPSAILGHDIHRCHRCHFMAVFYSPHSNPPSTAG